MSWALLASALLAIEIHAAGDCPAGADVERQLAPLLGDETAAHASDVARISRAADGSVSVSLIDAGGRSIGDRSFPRARTCGDQAKTVAVTLAIWEAQLHPEISLRLDRLASADAPAGAEAATTIARAAPPPPAPPRGRELSLGVAALGDWQSGTWAPGARVDFGLGPTAGRWRVRLSGLGIGRHTLDLPPGQVRWWRAVLQLGADVDVARGRRWALGLGAGALGGVVSISGSGFAVDRHPRSLDLGGEVRARVEARLGRVRPWLGASLVGWLRRQALDLQGAPGGSALPRLQPFAALGADFVW